MIQIQVLKTNWVHSICGIKLTFVIRVYLFIQIFICIVYFNISMYKERKMGSVCRLSSNNNLWKKNSKKCVTLNPQIRHYVVNEPSFKEFSGQKTFY